MPRRRKRGSGTLYRRRRNGREYGSWLAKLHINGRPVTINTRTDDYNEAMRLLQRHVERAQIGNSPGERINITIAGYVEHFLEQKTRLIERGRNKQTTFIKYRNILRNFTDFIYSENPEMRMNAVDTALMERYMDHRLGLTRFNKGNTPITRTGVNKEVEFIRTFFNQAVREGVISANPVNEELRRYDVRRTRTREHDADEIFSDEEVRRILAELRENDPEAYPVVATIALTGARRSEIQHLRRENVDLERNLLHIEADPETGWTPKNEASVRAAPICPELRDIIEDILLNRPIPSHNYLFSLPDGRPAWRSPGFPLRRLQSAIRQIRRDGEDVRMGTIRMLRHWFISTHLNRSVDPINPAEMMRLVGHTDMKMICRTYYHADLRRISEKMAGQSYLTETPEEEPLTAVR